MTIDAYKTVHGCKNLFGSVWHCLYRRAITVLFGSFEKNKNPPQLSLVLGSFYLRCNGLLEARWRRNLLTYPSLDYVLHLVFIHPQPVLTANPIIDICLFFFWFCCVFILEQ